MLDVYVLASYVLTVFMLNGYVLYVCVGCVLVIVVMVALLYDHMSVVHIFVFGHLIRLFNYMLYVYTLPVWRSSFSLSDLSLICLSIFAALTEF